jgi:hypothetical protein
MAKAKEVTVVEDQLPMSRPDWMAGDGTRGNEGVTSDDMTIPRVSIVQDLSPQHKENKPEYIEGAKPGMAFNTATNELYGSAMYVVPVLFRKEYVIWADINKGGGFHGAFPTMDEARTEMATLENAADCEISDTHQHFVLIVSEDSTADAPKVKQAVFSMSKSKCKPSRQWNTLVMNSGGDRFERLYKLSVVEAQNKAGQDYYNWRVDQQGYVSKALFEVAEKMYDAVRSGALDVKRDQEGSSPSEPTQGEIVDGEDF